MFWRRQKRRDRVRSQTFPPAWEEILRRNVRYYSLLPAIDQAELRGHAQVLIAEKNFEGCGGLGMNDEIRVTIAGQAGALLLHRDTEYFPQLKSVLVYPDAYTAPTVDHLDGETELLGEDMHFGESWGHGAVVLSWRHALEGARGKGRGENVILHEFAHQLDLEDGVTNGAPLLDDDDAAEEWARVLSGAYEELWRDVMRNRRTLIDAYGATDPGEFFAVITECFFERSRGMRRRHPDLYSVLQRFYRQDPAALERRSDPMD